MTTEKDGGVYFYLSGSGVATVDWGDGSEKVTLTLNENDIKNWANSVRSSSDGDGVWFSHTYSTASIRTVTVNGDNITEFRCTDADIWTSLDLSKNTELQSLLCARTLLTSLDLSKNTVLTHLCVNENEKLMSLDVSKNTALKVLLFHSMNNSVTSLDLSKNTALTMVSVYSPQLSTTALNSLFGALHSNTISGETKTIFIRGNPGAYDCDNSIAESKGWKVIRGWDDL
jgi:hypothetical protein